MRLREWSGRWTQQQMPPNLRSSRLSRRSSPQSTSRTREENRTTTTSRPCDADAAGPLRGHGQAHGSMGMECIAAKGRASAGGEEEAHAACPPLTKVT
eukprot:scaffold278995_cov32-Tisochrysis_lutea.AAC.2